MCLSPQQQNKILNLAHQCSFQLAIDILEESASDSDDWTMEDLGAKIYHLENVLEMIQDGPDKEAIAEALKILQDAEADTPVPSTEIVSRSDLENIVQNSSVQTIQVPGGPDIGIGALRVEGNTIVAEVSPEAFQLLTEIREGYDHLPTLRVSEEGDHDCSNNELSDDREN